jgi:3-hydroxybutyryl-CoA dehydrogenase
MGEIHRLGVVGAGQMGRGIAQVAAQAKLSVSLHDASARALDEGIARIRADLERLVQRQRLNAGEASAILARIRASASLAGLADSQVVVEAATESLDVKQAIFAELDRALPPEAILASNTSSISLTKIASATGRPAQVIGMHFMNPVPLMKLVEIVRGLQTDEATYTATCELAARLGKVVITTKDMPGFIVNRMLIPFINEACFALQEGLGSVEDIDQGAKLGLNHPMGPLELADLIGLDTCLHIGEVLQHEFGEDKYRPPSLLRNYVAAGWLGRKSGRGFYRYDTPKKN